MTRACEAPLPGAWLLASRAIYTGFGSSSSLDNARHRESRGFRGLANDKTRMRPTSPRRPPSHEVIRQHSAAPNPGVRRHARDLHKIRVCFRLKSKFPSLKRVVLRHFGNTARVLVCSKCRVSALCHSRNDSRVVDHVTNVFQTSRGTARPCACARNAVFQRSDAELGGRYDKKFLKLCVSVKKYKNST